MSDNTGIEWTDATWNPTTGCTKVSAGCDHCYAETIAHRFAGTAAYPDGFEPTLRPERLELPLRWTRPRRIFVNSMSDLFHDDVDPGYIAQVWATMARAPRHTFQILTKRHARMRSLVAGDLYDQVVAELSLATGHLEQRIVWPLPNVWLGVSVESQQWAGIRIPALLGTPAAVRFISAEPLLGPIELHPYWTDGRPQYGPAETLERGPRLDWVIAGGESGRGARPMHPDWPRSLRDQCVNNDVPFLFKPWGEWRPTRADDSLERRPVVEIDGRTMRRVGKKTAGRELDGRTWDQYPAAAA
jgi:protein gp37